MLVIVIMNGMVALVHRLEGVAHIVFRSSLIDVLEFSFRSF